MNIAIDIDDVLADSINPFIRYLKRKQGKVFTPDDFTTVQLHRILHCSADESQKIILDFYGSKEFDGIKPVKYSREAVAFLAKRHRLFAVTNRPESTKEKTLMFLGKNFGNVFYDTYFTGHITDNPGSKSPKADLLENVIGCQYFIDDNADNFAGLHPEKTCMILFSQPWNKQYASKDVTKLSGWKEVKEFFANE